MHQGIAPAVDALELVIARATQRFTMGAQHGGFVHAVTVGGRQIHDVVHAGGGMQLLAEALVGVRLDEESLQISNGHSDRAGISPAMLSDRWPCSQERFHQHGCSVAKNLSRTTGAGFHR